MFGYLLGSPTYEQVALLIFKNIILTVWLVAVPLVLYYLITLAEEK
jgi:hypothetical protein